MRIESALQTVSFSITRLQEFDKDLKVHGAALPTHDATGFSEGLYSLIYTSFGRDPAPSANPANHKGLRAKFLKALQKDYVPKQYQETVTRLENIIEDALRRYDDDKIISWLSKETHLSLNGDKFVSVLQEYGLTFRNAQRMDDLFTRCKKSPEPKTSHKPGV